MRTLTMVTAAFLLAATPAWALDMRGSIEGQVRFFKERPLYRGQETHSFSLAAEPEFYQAVGGSSSVTFVPFYRHDSADPERSHGDIRELFFLTYGDWWELRAGADKVFWGVTEFVHLVDIVNQVDALEGFDREDKLGQPMAAVSLIKGAHVLDLYVLPYFRRQPYPGEKGRLRSPLTVKTEEVAYEDSQKEKHVDLAARYKVTLGGLDAAVSWFRGTSREPTLKTNADVVGTAIVNGQPVPVLGNYRFFPYYEQIQQSGLELQYVADDWILKLEAIKRTGLNAGDHSAATAGLEYTLYGIFGSVADLGLLLEAAWDERGDNATTLANHDVMAGARLALNDMDGSEVLLGLWNDYRNGSQVVWLEAGRRLGTHWRLEAEGLFYSATHHNDISHFIRKDSFLQISLSWNW